MNEEQFKDRTKRLGIRVIKLVEALPNTRSAEIVSRQIVRSSTSVGANYRAACRAQSTADMLSNLKDVEEEADETLYWLEIIRDTEMIPEARLADLMRETNEILAMVVASIKTLRARLNRKS